MATLEELVQSELTHRTQPVMDKTPHRWQERHGRFAKDKWLTAIDECLTPATLRKAIAVLDNERDKHAFSITVGGLLMTIMLSVLSALNSYYALESSAQPSSALAGLGWATLVASITFFGVGLVVLPRHVVVVGVIR